MEENKEFSFTIHEIKNKLQVLLLNAEVLEKYIEKQKYDDPYLKKFVQRMKEEARNLYSFLLNISYIFKKENIMEEFNFYPFLNAIINNLREFSNKRKIAIKTKYDLAIKTIKQDRKKLEIIILNILKNSLEVETKRNEILVSVEKNNDKIIVSITNYGEPISQRMQKKIFEPGFSTKDEGSGIGLYIVKELIENIHGKIYIESDENTTSFITEFPEDLSEYEKNSNC